MGEVAYSPPPWLTIQRLGPLSPAVQVDNSRIFAQNGDTPLTFDPSNLRTGLTLCTLARLTSGRGLLTVIGGLVSFSPSFPNRPNARGFSEMMSLTRRGDHPEYLRRYHRCPCFRRDRGERQYYIPATFATVSVSPLPPSSQMSEELPHR